MTCTRLLLAAALAAPLALFACTAPAPESADANDNEEPGEDARTTDASSPDAPVPDAPTSDAPAPDAPPDAPTCNPADCPLGCHDTEPRCNDIDPSNGLAPYLDTAATGPVLAIPDGSVIDTDDGSITDSNGNAIAASSAILPGPEGGAAIRVYAVKSLTLGSIDIAGGPAVAFVANGDIVVTGTVVVDAGTVTDDVCRGTLGLCTTTVPESTTFCPASGGSGFGSAGGDGQVTVFGGQGGQIAGNASLTPLRGGCGGGLVKGGGAIQLVSRTEIAIESGGFLDLNGDGGQENPDPDISAALGGASGGGALLEAPRVSVANLAGITANGGGGAGSCFSSAQDGFQSEAPAQGGQCADPEANGGTGGARTSPEGGNGQVASEGTGAGGGGVGRIRINVLTGGLDADDGAIISPLPSVAAVATR